MAGETRDDGSDDVPRRSISIEPEKWWKNAQSRGERREEGEEWKKEKKEEIGGGGPIKRGRERRRMNGRAVWNLGNAHSLLFSFFPLSFFFLFPPPPSPPVDKADLPVSWPPSGIFSVSLSHDSPILRTPSYCGWSGEWRRVTRGEGTGKTCRAIYDRWWIGRR